jgi:GT2 family glycosyltransferase
MPRIAVIIPNWNGARHLGACLASLARQDPEPAEVWIVDNGSTDDSLEIAGRAYPGIQVIAWRDNRGFAAAANAGIRAAQCDWAAVLNNDTEVAPGWLAACSAAARRYPDAAFLACRILDFAARDTLYSAGDCFLRAGVGYRRGQGMPDRPEYRQDAEVFSACGCAALYRKTVFEGAGGYDERFFAYLEDVELGLRLRAAGHRGYYAAAAVVYHRGGATSGGEFSPLSVRLRTRNALYLLLKNYPAAFLWRACPMIALMQISWLARAAAHGRILSYLRGAAAVVPLLPAALRARRLVGRASSAELWQAIMLSEAMARRDFTANGGRQVSLLLHWYFRLFG